MLYSPMTCLEYSEAAQKLIYHLVDLGITMDLNLKKLFLRKHHFGDYPFLYWFIPNSKVAVCP